MKAWAIAAIALTLGDIPAAGQQLTASRAQLSEAKRAAVAANARAEHLIAEAAGERNAADRARAQERALAAKVEVAASDVAAATARNALIERMLAERRQRLAAAELPVARLLAALQSLARPPTVALVAQPGSIEDAVRVRAVLGSALPAIRARTAAVRTELAATRRLQADAILAGQALRDRRAALEASRVALAQLEANHRARSQAFGRDAMSEQDRALALGERARDLVDRLDEEGSAATTAAALVGLPGPLPRPLAPGAKPPPAPHGVYRMPVEGRVVTGFGEVSDAGVRSRGLTLAVAPGAVVVAPAGGVVRYARGFRNYGVIVIVDHAAGWSSLVTGLASTAVRPGEQVGAGTPLGRAERGNEPLVTVELRRRGRPMDLAALLG